MNTKKNKRSFLSILLSILLILTIIAVGGGIIAPNLARTQQTAQAAESAGTSTPGLISHVERPEGATFGKFPDGYVYAYTDKTLSENLHKGVSGATTDLKTQTVSSGTHGSMANPFVIETTADWENFAKHASTTAEATQKNQVFVLARDIDFTGVTDFRSIPTFYGKFYGVGHTLSNVTIKTWQYWTGSAWTNNTSAKTNAGFGLFDYVQNATIADFNLVNFAYSSMPSLQAYITQWGNYMGGIAGITYGATTIMNCHVQGTVTGGTFQNYAWTGGLVGIQVATGLMIYRCSADTNFTVNCNTESWHTHHGGLLGDVYESGSAYIYDCVTNCTGNFAGKNPQVGGVIGYLRSKATAYFENIVSYANYANTLDYAGVAYGPMYGTMTLKNAFMHY